MTQDQHENLLRIYYREALSKTRAYLESRYKIDNDLGNDKDAKHVHQLNPTSTIWRITATGIKRSFTFLVAIPPTFPDNLPKFYLTEKDFLDFGFIPHVDKNRFVCTRDPAVVVLNDSYPGEALEKLLQIAIQILEVGLKGESQQDFENEFLAYWNEHTELQTIMIDKIPKTPSVLIQYEVKPQLFGASFLIATSKSSARSWITRLRVEIKLDNANKVLCLQLPKIPESVPMTNGDIKRIINGLDKESAKSIRSFHGNIILACVPINRELVLISWRHPDFPVKGFRTRSKSIPLYLRISTRNFEFADIKKFRVRRFDRVRLVKRAVDMSIITKDHLKLAIVGCGSIGSVLTMLLARSGCSLFTLVDPEDLTEENVARHLCGCHALATTSKKVMAVKSTLESHLPFVSCNAYDKDVLDILITGPQVFDDAELLIIAVANMATERRINDFFVLERPKRVVYLWLEPYGVAGHILYISPNNGGCYRCCFNSHGDFRFAVIAKNQDFVRREAGCQQSFTPYGAADLEMFCAIACKEIIRLIQEPPTQSILLTWIGDKEKFQLAGYKISDNYAAHDSYSLHKRDIAKIGTCETCKKKG